MRTYIVTDGRPCRTARDSARAVLSNQVKQGRRGYASSSSSFFAFADSFTTFCAASCGICS